MSLIGLIRTVVCFSLVCSCSETIVPSGPDSHETDPVLARRLIAGEKVACALTSEGKVFCWGLNSVWWEYGASPEAIAGDGAPIAAQVPELTSLAQGVGAHFCGITEEQKAICWGRGGNGQLGGGVVGDMGNAFSTVQGDITWADISVGRITTCGLSTTGNGYCWGTNQSGEVGSPSIAISEPTAAPIPVHGGYFFTTVVAGWLHACGITTSGAVYCWGGNSSGQLGIGVSDTVRRRMPVPISGNLTFKQITLGSRYTCGLTTAGDAYCWGQNGTGQLGDGTLTERNEPTLVAGGLKYTSIAASSGFGTGAFAPPVIGLQGGVGHTCAIATDGKAYCWGWNANGQLGEGTTEDKSVPTAVAGNLTLSAIAVGGAYSCGMQGDNVWCWGSNANGQLGKGDIVTHAFTPQAVLSPFKQ